MIMPKVNNATVIVISNKKITYSTGMNSIRASNKAYKNIKII